MFYLIFCFKLIYNRRFIRKLGFYITHYANTKYLVSDMCRPQRILQQYQPQFNALPAYKFIAWSKQYPNWDLSY